MPTDDECREIAARLRDMAPGSDWPKYVAEACGMDVSKMSNHFHTYTAQLCQRLADLIETEPEFTCRIEQISETEMQCSKCGEVYCWTEVDYFEGGVLSYNGAYCRKCGAKVVKDAD